MNDLIFMIIKAVVYVLFAVVARYAIPWLMTRAKASNYQLLAVIVEDAVRAFEQTITGEGEGARRKDVVTQYIIDTCKRYNIPIDPAQIDVLIEQAVKAMNDERKGEPESES